MLEAASQEMLRRPGSLILTNGSSLEKLLQLNKWIQNYVTVVALDREKKFGDATTNGLSIDESHAGSKRKTIFREKKKRYDLYNETVLYDGVVFDAMGKTKNDLKIYNFWSGSFRRPIWGKA